VTLRATVQLVTAALTGTALALGGGVPALAAAVDAPPEAWHVAALHLAEAHTLSRGAGVIVAVLDSGAAPHKDLNGALLPPVDVAPSGARSEPARGTALAGLIAARGGGRSGLLGVAPQAKILPVRVSGRGFDARPDRVAAGIDRAVDAGAHVIVSTYARPEVSGALAAAVRRAVAADVLVVAPAAPATATTVTLGDLPGVVSVTGARRDGRPVRDVVTGLRIDVAAPGENLVAPVRTSLGDAYAEVSGAEFAAALAGGIAALVRSKFPRLPAADVSRRLELGTQRDMSLGWGSIDAVEALNRPLEELPAPKPAVAMPPASTLPRDRQWYLDAVRLPDAHRITVGGNVTLGLVAGKIDTDRPDLTGRLGPQTWINTDGSEGDPPTGAARPVDTAAAVLAGGAGGTGYLGAAPGARLIAASGGAQQSAAQVEAAVRWLVDHGAKVVLVIDGARSLTPAAAAYALGHDAVLVAPHSPTAPAVPGVIAVRGVRQGELISSGRSPSLTAPGEANLLLGDGQVASASPDESAAALVAGTAALVRARHPQEDAKTTVQRLLSTASPVTGESAAAYGRGVVDPVSALTKEIKPVANNPLGEPPPKRHEGGRERTSWTGIAAVGAGALILAGLLAWILRRRRTRPVVTAQEN
jgi:hypothetical protein